jgi:VacB/RNase II family 3'-5' exoribonuclease
MNLSIHIVCLLKLLFHYLTHRCLLKTKTALTSSFFEVPIMNDHANDIATLERIARRSMVERDLDPDFPPEVEKEVDAIEGPAPCAAQQSKDLTNIPWISIDNDDSRDLDQLTYAERISDDAVKAYVAIADVDALVPKGSAIDLHAQHNTTSVYTSPLVFPMLPLKLSTDLTSLNENVDRRAMVVEFIVRKDGSLGDYNIYPACVRNHAKLTYNGVQAWINGDTQSTKISPPNIANQIKLQDAIAQSIKADRHNQGALTFLRSEVEPVISGDKVVDLKAVLPNRANELIENFMIAANNCVTKFLFAKNSPTLTRVVRKPKRWERIVAIAHSLGTKLPAEPNSKALEAFLKEQHKKNPNQFEELSFTMIKLLGRGEYVAMGAGKTPIGHFDLALRDYSHTTAPNRRYPDLIMQRLLKSSFLGTVAYTFEELDTIAQRATLKEDDAVKVERRVNKSAEAMLLSNQIGKTFKAIVTGASEKGTWVKLIHPPIEGKLVKGFQGVDVGDHVQVQLMRVDVNNGFIDFSKV